MKDKMENGYIERGLELHSAICRGCNKEFEDSPCEPSECQILSEIFGVPTADVVKVVRCKDCYYAEEMEGIIGGTCLYCTHWCKDVDGDTFCSYGFSTMGRMI